MHFTACCKVLDRNYNATPPPVRPIIQLGPIAVRANTPSTHCAILSRTTTVSFLHALYIGPYIPGRRICTSPYLLYIIPRVSRNPLYIALNLPYVPSLISVSNRQHRYTRCTFYCMFHDASILASRSAAGTSVNFKTPTVYFDTPALRHCEVAVHLHKGIMLFAPVTGRYNTSSVAFLK